MANILIVDDSRTSRKILREVLEGAGHTVVGEASNGEEGIALYKELKPDLVTLDITMPVMNGLEALEGIRNEDKEAKIVMITAAGQKEKMVKAIKEGASDFITKPFEAGIIIETVNNLVK
ncbi:response regulator [Kineothrix sp. MB12-C1]|uniref:response regulator n=1 Tax=Kineothrix sp. MB12-C1 TaxID=3070215 RepID=UPI0027D1FDE9|nr:response regulator [Kineothrix sp. MB12-C1]WMC92963.1 response regulator [Kineothrix sp. MB12-C1]